MYDKILLAADGSDHSLRAADHAIFIAQQNSRSSLVVLYVVDLTTSKSDVLRHLDTDTLNRKRREKLSAIEQKAKEAGLNYEIQILHGEPGPTIVEYGDSYQFDLIVIGSRGLNTLQEMVLGSVSHKVAKRAHCPVMIVK